MSNYTLLLIDYEPRSIERMRRPLEQSGIRVEVATDGSTGLAAFERLQPDAVIVEAMLPKRHGFEVCQEIKKTALGKRTPVIVTTGVYKGRRYRTQAMHIHGADEYLEKPLTDEQIVDTVRRFLADRPARPAPAPDAAPPAPAAGAAGGADDIFEIIDESLSLPQAAPKPIAKPAPRTTAPKPQAGTPFVADLTEDEISARLDALLPSDPATPTEVMWQSGHAIGHLEPGAEPEVRATPTAVAVEVETEIAPPALAPIPEVPAAAEEIEIDPRGVDLEAPRPEGQVVPFEPARQGRRREASAGPAAPPRALGTAAVAPVAEIAPTPGAAPFPNVEIPLTENYETPSRGLPRWIWAVAAVGLGAGLYVAFFRSAPSQAAADPAVGAPPVALAAPAGPSSANPEPVSPPAAVTPPVPSPAEAAPARAVPEHAAATQNPGATLPAVAAPPTPKPVAVAAKPLAPSPAPTFTSAPTVTSAAPPTPTTPPSSATLENLEDPSLAVAPVTAAVVAPAPPKPTTRAGDLVSINEVDSLPIGIEKPSPQYTPLARTRRQEGTVVMELLVDETGRVADVRLIRGIAGSDLNDAAMKAARGWVYKPAEKDGVPVRVWRPEQVRFRL